MNENFYLKSIKLFNCQKRPEIFLENPKHCSECVEHEETLQKYTYENIPIDELDNPGWNPICYISTTGFAYYIPAFIRLILEQTKDSECLGQFLFHINYNDSKNKFLNYFSFEQKRFLISFLSYLLENSPKYGIDKIDEEYLIKAINLWKKS